MRQTIIAAVAAFVVGGAATGAMLSQAQPTPPAAQVDGGPGWGHGPHGMMGPPGMIGMHHHAFNLRQFALVFPQSDRQLTPPDVQKIAEAFLLWNGNHSWKVTDVAASQDGSIAFSLATAEGSLVAKFTMNPHTGRVTRIS